ncbi:MAG: DUF4199 domain-containing protein [Niastella sp.]|nr:DUF4199 domain-containing protein [Niastella sp.]
MKINATRKGILASILMIGVSLLIFVSKHSFQNNLQYISYSIYVLAIIWAILDYKKNQAGSASFKNLFNEGFKCFIVVTLFMVIFTFVFLKLQPQLREEMAVNFKKELTEKGDYTTAEIETRVTQAKDFFVTTFVSTAIFGYLIIGAMVSAIASAFFAERKFR